MVGGCRYSNNSERNRSNCQRYNRNQVPRVCSKKITEPTLPLWLTFKESERNTKLLGQLYHTPSFTCDFVRTLGEEVLAFASWIKPTEQEQRQRAELVERVRVIINELWPETIVKVFGSSETVLTLPSSDVDFVVEGLETETAMNIHLEDLSHTLHQNGMINVRVLAHAKVPLVKFEDSLTKLFADVSFGVPNACESVELTQAALLTYPVAAPLIVVLKTSLRQNNINLVHAGGLSSYAVTLLVISYLKLRQHEEKQNITDSSTPTPCSPLTSSTSEFPCISSTSSDRENYSDSESILALEALEAEIEPAQLENCILTSNELNTDNCTGQFSSATAIESNQTKSGLEPYNVGKCLVGFMQYFASTDLNNTVFSPANNNPVTLTLITSPSNPPVLVDPLDSNNDILRGSFNFFRVQELWWYSLHALSSYVPGMVPSTLSTFINPRDFTFLSRFANASFPQVDDRGD